MSNKTESLLPAFTPPPAKTMGRLLTVQRLWHRPWMTGLENIDPQRPTLFVGNHTLYGMLDVPLLGYEIYQRKGVYIRGLADRMHFKIPVWREVFKWMGSVVGSRENCSALMQSGAHIMVFPGGSREVAKRKGEAYQLIWKDRTGFARMAVEHGYRIIPFAAVGAEDCFDILIDSNDVMGSGLVKWLKTTALGSKFIGDGEQLFPLSRGLGLSMIPRPERFYFSFGEPIETAQYKGESDDPAVLAEVRDAVKASIETQLTALLKVQAKDPQRGLVGSLAGGVQSLLASAPAMAAMSAMSAMANRREKASPGAAPARPPAKPTRTRKPATLAEAAKAAKPAAARRTATKTAAKTATKPPLKTTAKTVRARKPASPVPSSVTPIAMTA
jgi:1-acyl-sn-glycerol-3-phosphate acyltransferase